MSTIQRKHTKENRKIWDIAYERALSEGYRKSELGEMAKKYYYEIKKEQKGDDK